MIASAIGFVALAVVHNLLDAIAGGVADIPLVPLALEALSAFTFLVAVLLCPAGFAVGLGGWVLRSLTRNKDKAAL